ncbi:hypothetical protein [Synechococcus sp. MIT S1220]|uniref:hypothetical protein n=1 Tax=Synechococcus sp. MIT S1220 TaxID=3082549 RepID=UPI0039AF3C64
MPKIFYHFSGLFLISGCLVIQLDHHVQAAPKRSTTVVECVLIDGDFKGNGFIYEINNNRTKVRLLKAFETSKSGVRSNFDENADMLFLSNENEVLTFRDIRLQKEQGIIYTEKLDLNTLTSTTLTIEIVEGSEQIIETDSSKCRNI